MIRNISVDFAKALANPTRQKIMRLCSDQWISVNDIMAQINVSQPSVSYHLAVLHKAELVKVQSVGRQVFYLLDQNKIVDCCRQLMIDFVLEQP